MTTAGKGNATEAAVLNAFVAADYPVLVPFGGGHAYDLGVDLDRSGFLRIQCKTGRPSGDCVVFNSRTTDHGYGRRTYDGLADIFGVHFPPTGAVYLVPVSEVPGFVPRLRLRPTQNNQKQGIRFAADYEFEKWSLARLAEVARSGQAPSGVAANIA
jgi:hypothetical protein